MLKPEHAPAIEAAIAFLERSATEPSLEEIARVAGMSPSHFQRVFCEWTGVSPKQLVRFKIAGVARALLARGEHAVLDVALATGLSSAGRLHDLTIATEALTPGEIRRGGAGLEIRWGEAESPFGKCLVAETARGVCALRFIVGERSEEELRELRTRWPRAQFSHDESQANTTARKIFAPVSGEKIAARETLRVLLRGTAFQLKVWEALMRIPLGSTVSYQQVARAVGRPRAVRAVGTAVGENPIAFLIPCHRVLRKSGALGGYLYGLDRKQLLLARESVWMPSANSSLDDGAALAIGKRR